METLKKKIEAAKLKTPQRKFLARFDESEYQKLEAEAIKQKLSINALIKIACRDMLETLSKKKTG
jgi:predicted HicB family RNase H-like nuclease